jgi:exopolysaccharide biosynthesis operon protein EpsL
MIPRMRAGPANPPHRRAPGAGGPPPHARRRLGACALACAVACAAAAPWPAAAQTQDTLVLSATQAFQYDSNVLRLPSWISPAQVTNGAVDSRSDLISTTSVGARFDREASLQRLRADAALNFVRYRDYSYLDYDGYNAGATWDWATGRQWYGTASARAERFLASFVNVSDGARNIVDQQQYRFQAGYRFTPAWSAVGALGGVVRNNSAPGYQQNDWRATGFEAGARWEPRSGADWQFLWRRTDGNYPNRQVTDSLGNPLPVTVDNAYTEDRLFTRVGLEPTGRTRLEGELGYTRRDFQTLSQRDFSGFTWDLVYLWRPSDALTGSAYARRNLGGTEFLTSSYIDTRVVGAGPTWQLTGKTSLQAVAEYWWLDYDGDPGFVADPGARRQDRLATVSGTLSWEPMRKVTLSAQLRWGKRTSNYDQYDFNAYGGGITGQIRY